MRLERTFYVRFSVLLKNGGSRVLFIGPASIFFSKNNFKTRSHNTIHTFKNYFAIVFLIFSNKRYSNRPYIYSMYTIMYIQYTYFFNFVYQCAQIFNFVPSIYTIFNFVYSLLYNILMNVHNSVYSMYTIFQMMYTVFSI